MAGGGRRKWIGHTRSALQRGDQAAISFQQTDAIVQDHGQDVIRAATDKRKSNRRSGFDYRDCFSLLMHRKLFMMTNRGGWPASLNGRGQK